MDELMSEYTIHCLRIAIGVALVLIVASCAVGYTIRGALA